MQTYKQLQDQVLAWLDESGDTGTTLTNVKNALNQAHQDRLATEDWPFLLWDTAETFTLTADQRIYPLHQAFWRPHFFFNRTSKAYLIEIPGRALASTGARWNDDTGTPVSFRFAGRTPVERQPTAASTISIVSSSASDTTAAKAVTIRGVTSDGITAEALTPNGTTTVTSTGSFSKILQITKAASWAGTMTMTAGATTLLKLFATELSRSYQQIELLASPQAADVIEYRFFRLPSPLTNDNDIPDIPEPHEQLLVWDALLLFAGYNTDLNPQAIGIWRDKQQKLERSLYLTHLEGHSLEAHPRFIRYIDEDSPSPRIYRS